MGGNNQLASYVTTILSSIFGVVLMVRVFSHWGRSEWGKLFTCFIGASLAAYCIFKPAAAVQLLTGLGTLIASVFQ
ncbi:TcpD family membrane protein [Streptomyces sp. H10-C2]|uniref:TcpD family membrane protein n=1 Tax=unclassified Streptomyces TaxID=2593676 RepID=UPI0024B88B5D|nr:MULTISPECIES: TcpD family membrane protein [unclassified Streptomyces]MDJ0346962.1 TcpD family membrane protein [Streptomyces sp. PH10-H1]MDJ0374627.1 TcpD family membrane protein [Streptomyces sp. H10-C2]